MLRLHRRASQGAWHRVGSCPAHPSRMEFSEKEQMPLGTSSPSFKTEKLQICSARTLRPGHRFPLFSWYMWGSHRCQAPPRRPLHPPVLGSGRTLGCRTPRPPGTAGARSGPPGHRSWLRSVLPAPQRRPWSEDLGPLPSRGHGRPGGGEQRNGERNGVRAPPKAPPNAGPTSASFQGAWRSIAFAV